MVAAWTVWIFGMGADCTEVGPGAADVGAAEGYEMSDGGGVDAAGRCAPAATPADCRRRTECRWLSATCEGGTVVSGCFPASSGPTIPVSCGSDAGTASDVGAADAGPAADCGRFREAGTCDAQPRCWWWAPRCGDTSARPRCLSEGELPDEVDRCARTDVGGGGGADVGSSADAGSGRDVAVAPEVAYDDTGHAAADAGTGADVAPPDCASLTDRGGCGRAAGCKWWSASCHGNVVAERCVPATSYPTPPKCKTVRAGDCYKLQQESRCGGPNCDWVTGGCGQPSVGTVKLNTCLPAGTCRANRDCPTNHLCKKVWLKPCEGRACRSCGTGVMKCVPTGLLKP